VGVGHERARAPGDVERGDEAAAGDCVVVLLEWGREGKDGIGMARGNIPPAA
jgi:hypothetical protein